MARAVLINPVRSSEKHPSNPLAVRQRFLNFGLLALGTYLAVGHDVRIFDEYVLEGELESHIFNEFGSSVDVIGLSCISAYSAATVRNLATRLKSSFPAAAIVLGGQHFAGNWGAEFVAKMPAV